MDEVQHLADSAVVIADGRVLAAGKPDSLGSFALRETVIRFRLDEPDTIEQLPEDLRALVSSHDGEVVLRTTHPTRVLLDKGSHATAGADADRPARRHAHRTGAMPRRHTPGFVPLARRRRCAVRRSGADRSGSSRGRASPGHRATRCREW
jgi:ABC-type multidrug transport system ATPase subunit